MKSSFPDGRSYYDRTKALGEVNDRKNLTFRNSIVGPDINEDGIGLFHWFMKQEGGYKWLYQGCLDWCNYAYLGKGHGAGIGRESDRTI